MVLFIIYFNYLAIEIITKTERRYNLLFFNEKIAFFHACYVDIICAAPPLWKARERGA
jgi:hypothetical protein